MYTGITSAEGLARRAGRRFDPVARPPVRGERAPIEVAGDVVGVTGVDEAETDELRRRPTFERGRDLVVEAPAIAEPADEQPLCRRDLVGRGDVVQRPRRAPRSVAVAAQLRPQPRAARRRLERLRGVAGGVHQRLDAANVFRLRRAFGLDVVALSPELAQRVPLATAG